MLQIFEKSKADTLLRHSEKRMPSEDILTGAVFGILTYVESNTALEMLKTLLGSDVALPRSVTRIKTELWPRVSSNQGQGWIEPDVQIDLFSGENHSLRIIIESKLNAPLRPRQAIEQWLNLSGEAKKTWHIFPVRHITRTEQELAQQDKEFESENGSTNQVADWKQHRRCIAWFDMARAVIRSWKETEGSPDRSHLHSWAWGVRCALKHMGEKPFEGFSRLIPADIGEHVIGSRVFWIGGDLRAFTWPEPIEIGAGHSSFFRSRPKVEVRHDGRK